MNDLVSVVVPMYNSSLQLEVTIESLLAQTYDNIELIFVDDNSSDDTIRVLESLLSSSDIPWKLYHNDGPSAYKPVEFPAVFITGILASRGKYITIHGSDDTSTPDRIEKLVSAIGGHSMVASHTNIISSDHSSVWSCHENLDGINKILETKHPFRVSRMIIGPHHRILIMSTLFRRDFFIDYQLYMLNDSWELFTTYLAIIADGIAVVDEALYTMYSTDNKISTIDRSKAYKENGYDYDECHWANGDYYYYSPYLMDIVVNAYIGRNDNGEQ